MEDKVKIYSYTKVWKVEKKIYAISNISLPLPINPYDFLAFIGVALIVLIFCKIIPALNVVPVVIRYIAIPYACVHYLMKKKVDGKNPIMYFIGCMVFLFAGKGRYIQHFKAHNERESKEVIKWNCSRGYREGGCNVQMPD